MAEALRLGLVCTIICVLFGYPLAYFLARAEPQVKAIGLFLLLMPLMVSAVIRTFGWLVILGRRGLANNVLEAFGFDRVALLYHEPAVVIGLTNVFIPFMVLPLMASIERIESGAGGSRPQSRGQLVRSIQARHHSSQQPRANFRLPPGLQRRH